MRKKQVPAVVLPSVFFAAIFACGSRTGLLSTEVPPAADAGLRRDGSDARADVNRDVQLVDVLPPIDVKQRDVPKPPPLGCFDAGDTQVYLITAENDLLAFYPPTLNFTTIGPIACPGAEGQTPFSMGVERSGTAYSVFTDGRLFRISTATAACRATSFAVGQRGFTTFGMGFAGNNLSEQLYVSDNATQQGLATINTSNFQLSFVGPFTPALPARCEMTGTGDNELFAYCINTVGAGGVVAQIDRATGSVIAANPVKVGSVNDAFAFAAWGGNFYMFNAQGGTTVVTRYDPTTNIETVVANHPSTIVGAGVSTCAPN
jgi:hypothetical protein